VNTHPGDTKIIINFLLFCRCPSSQQLTATTSCASLSRTPSIAARGPSGDNLISYNKGLKLKSIGGPHSKEKMFRGLQFIGKSFCGSQFTRKISQNQLNLVKFHNFETFAGRANASGGPYAGRVFETPVLEHWFSTFFGWRHIFYTIIFGDTFLSENTCVSDKFACSFIKMKSQNNLATQCRKFAAHECVATPCLRTTASKS
jgi:hypothetical protein